MAPGGPSASWQTPLQSAWYPQCSNPRRLASWQVFCKYITFTFPSTKYSLENCRSVPKFIPYLLRFVLFFVVVVFFVTHSCKLSRQSSYIAIPRCECHWEISHFVTNRHFSMSSSKTHRKIPVISPRLIQLRKEFWLGL